VTLSAGWLLIQCHVSDPDATEREAFVTSSLKTGEVGLVIEDEGERGWATWGGGLRVGWLCRETAYTAPRGYVRRI